MNKTKALCLAALLVAPLPARASEIGQSGHPFGLGIMLGYPTAISGKYYLGGRANALDFAVASASYRWGERGGAYVHLTYLWHPSVLTSEPGFDLTWHFGVGGVVWSRYWGIRGRDEVWYGDTAAGVRVPIGLDFDLNQVRLQFFGDIAGHVFIAPGVFIDIAASIGGRYYF